MGKKSNTQKYILEKLDNNARKEIIKGKNVSTKNLKQNK